MFQNNALDDTFKFFQNKVIEISRTVIVITQKIIDNINKQHFIEIKGKMLKFNEKIIICKK